MLIQLPLNFLRIREIVFPSFSICSNKPRRIFCIFYFIRKNRIAIFLNKR
nr:MAG TPA: hypothetical protein [Caudoviricetes sp.]